MQCYLNISLCNSRRLNIKEHVLANHSHQFQRSANLSLRFKPLLPMPLPNVIYMLWCGICITYGLRSPVRNVWHVFAFSARIYRVLVSRSTLMSIYIIYKAQAIGTYVQNAITTTLQIRWLTSFAHMSTRPPLIQCEWRTAVCCCAFCRVT